MLRALLSLLLILSLPAGPAIAETQTAATPAAATPAAATPDAVAPESSEETTALTETNEPWVDTPGSPQFFAVLVTDMDRSVAWYQKVFGLEDLGGSASDTGAWAIENLGNAGLLVELIRDHRAEEVGRPLGFRKVGFAVDDVETVADRVEQATGERPRVVDFVPMNQRILQIRDPDGNTIQLFSVLGRN